MTHESDAPDLNSFTQLVLKTQNTSVYALFKNIARTQEVRTDKNREVKTA